MTMTTTQPDQPGPADAPHGVAEARSLFDGPILRQALVDSLTKLNPAVQIRNPVMFVVLVGSDRHLRRGDRPPRHLHLVHHHLAVPDGDLRQLRRGHGRGPGQGAGRHAAPDALGDRGAPAPGRRDRGAGAGGRAEQGGHGRLRGQRPHPLRRRDHRGHRLGRRVGHHRRVGPGHPRVGRRPLGRHRRHQGALRPHRRPHHGRARSDLPRPHDHPGRGGQPAEDAQRDRPHHPAGRPHHHLHPGRGVARGVRHLRRAPRSRSSSWWPCWSA